VNPLRRDEKELAFDYSFGLTFPEDALKVEVWITHNEQAAAIHTRIQAARGPLESLHPEPCAEALAEHTIRFLRAVAQGAQAAGRRRTTHLRSHYWEDSWPCLSSNILMTLSS
jgi:hypothetical protein